MSSPNTKESNQKFWNEETETLIFNIMRKIWCQFRFTCEKTKTKYILLKNGDCEKLFRWGKVSIWCEGNLSSKNSNGSTFRLTNRHERKRWIFICMRFWKQGKESTHNKNDLPKENPLSNVWQTISIQNIY